MVAFYLLAGLLGAAMVSMVGCQQFVSLPNGQRPNNNNNNNVAPPQQISGNNNQFPGAQFPNPQPQTNVQQPGPFVNPPVVTPTQAVVAGTSIAFMVRRGIRSTQTNQNGAYISYQQEATRVNSNINAASGIFLVQIPGVYAFSISGTGASNSAFRITLRKNGDVIALIFGLQSQMASESAVVSVNIGDYIYPTVEGAISDSSFSGYVIAMTEDKSTHPSRASSTVPPFNGGIFGNPFDPFNNGNFNNGVHTNPFGGVSQNDFFSGNRPLYSGFPNNNGLSRASNNTRVASSKETQESTTSTERNFTTEK